MTNNTETHTLLNGATARLARNNDGRLNKRSRTIVLDDLADRLRAARETVSDFETAYPEGTDSDAVIDRWNDAHDAVSAAEAAYRDAELNRAPMLVGSSEWLAFNNID